MSPREKDDISGVETTGHEWDGIRELDNPLPRWWLGIFWVCVAVAIAYWVLYPAWPGLKDYTHGTLGASDRADVARDLAELKAIRGAEGAQLKNASLQQIESDPKLQAYALEVGKSIFGDNCATCHGTGGTGGKGYPNLRDDVWLWGGTLEDIQHTITVGIRSDHPQARFSQMPAFGKDGLLSSAQVADMTEYVVALSGRPHNAAMAARAAQPFQDNCASCHGPQGKGMQAQGGPDLTDADWLYGSKRADIQGQIWNGRGGVMPTWEKRFDPETIKALTVYIHANAAGQ